MDLEDAYKLKILTFDETVGLMMAFFDETAKNKIADRIGDEHLTDPNEKIQYLRACVIGKLENECVKTFIDHEEEILAGTFEGSLIEHMAPMQRDAYRKCTEISLKTV